MPGGSLLVIGVLLATGHLRGRRQRPAEATHGPEEKNGWVQRVLQEPRYGLAILIGAAVGTPGAPILPRCIR